MIAFATILVVSCSPKSGTETTTDSTKVVVDTLKAATVDTLVVKK